MDSFFQFLELILKEKFGSLSVLRWFSKLVHYAYSQFRDRLVYLNLYSVGR